MSNAKKILAVMATLGALFAAGPAEGEAGRESAVASIPLSVIPEGSGGGSPASGGGVVWPASEGAGVPSSPTPAPVIPDGTTSPTPPGGAETVIGPDGRTQVTNTTTAPSSRIGQLNFSQGGPVICTGWLIDPNTILTSGHCVHSGGALGIPSTSMSFAPGRNGGTNPFGTCSATALFTSAAWLNNGTPAHDWGMVHLDCDIGDTVGWFGYRSLADNVLLDRAVTVRGYPGDQDSGTMWTMTDRIRSLSGNGLSVRYRADTGPGQSGSPVYEATGCSGPCGLAVHSYGCPGGEPCPAPNNHNSGPRLTADRVDSIYQTAAGNDEHPDAHVRRLSAATFFGNDRINLSGAGQTLTDLGVARGVTRKFVVRVQNDGTVTDDFSVRGAGASPNLEVKWFRGSTNITSQVRAGSYQVEDLAAGATVDLRVEIKVKNTAPDNARVNVKTTIRAATSPNYRDVVGTNVSR